ncbi:MAG: hypothetical protein ACTHKK_11650, partial [Candidatus Nitrosocosmicus sp.]
MNNVLVDQSLGLKRRVQADDNRIDESYRVGVEVEACLLDDKALPVNASPLIKELSSKYKVDSEYGKCQFEVITDPMSMHNLSNINSFFQE